MFPTTFNGRANGIIPYYVTIIGYLPQDYCIGKLINLNSTVFMHIFQTVEVQSPERRPGVSGNFLTLLGFSIWKSKSRTVWLKRVVRESRILQDARAWSYLAFSAL